MGKGARWQENNYGMLWQPTGDGIGTPVAHLVPKHIDSLTPEVEKEVVSISPR